MRMKAVKEGAGPMPAHKKVAGEHRDGAQPVRRSPRQTERNGSPRDVKVAEKADVLYFPGCSASYRNPEIAQSTAKILNGSGTAFTAAGR